jgi:hypothetical protein
MIVASPRPPKRKDAGRTAGERKAKAARLRATLREWKGAAGHLGAIILRNLHLIAGGGLLYIIDGWLPSRGIVAFAAGIGLIAFAFAKTTSEERDESERPIRQDEETDQAPDPKEKPR